MSPFIECGLITVCYLILFFFWGRTFLSLIHARTYISDCLAFGYIFMQAFFQIVYLPFLLSRGSFRALSYTWIIILVIITCLMLVFLRKNGELKFRIQSSKKRLSGAAIVLIITVSLTLLIASRPRPYGADTVGYINPMNWMVYDDSIFIQGSVNFHHGLNSIFALFTIPAIITGIRPIYLAEFTMREVSIILTISIAYRTGRVAFKDYKNDISYYGLALSVIVMDILMMWESPYISQFFYRRSNEAKAFCQFVLLPLAFSVWIQLFQNNENDKHLWAEQFLLGFAAIPVATSSMTVYPIMTIIATAGLLVCNRLKRIKTILLKSFLCILPNLLYMGLYIISKQEIFIF